MRWRASASDAGLRSPVVSPNKKRRRHLRRQSARKQRLLPPLATEIPVAHFFCAHCGLQFTQPGVLIGGLKIMDEHGNVVDAQGGSWSAQAPCPECGQSAEAVNQHHISIDGVSMMGFASTPAELEDLYTALAELRQLGEDASVDEVVEALASAGTIGQRLAQYVIEHREEIQALGTIVGIVIALLAWLVPNPVGDAPPLPEGVTYEQMERLIAELDTDAPSAPEHSHEAPAESPAEPEKRKN